MKTNKPRALSATAIVALLLGTSVVDAQEYRVSGQLLPAETGDISLRVEPGVALALTSPQSDIFDVGGGQSIKLFFALTPWLDIGPSATFVTLPPSDDVGEPGNAWAFGGGLRVKRPHDLGHDTFSAISPWVDADALFIRTGDLNRPGFTAGVGVAVPVDDDRTLWLGPFARYMHILQGTPDGFDNHDAKMLSIGLSLDWGPGIEREPERVATMADAPPCPITSATTVPCPDADGDGILDVVDRCPDVVGAADNWGCRSYEKVVITKDKLELKERLYFAWNQSTLQKESYPVLDDVAVVLKENKNFRVQVEGHTSSEGGEEHNQTLSEQRAQVVLDYLVAHGVDRTRLVSKGFASSVPTGTNDTVQGRDNNRRVEFVVTAGGNQ
ncbi:MAG: OmpA family protein [Polyangiaceae bacterium]